MIHTWTTVEAFLRDLPALPDGGRRVQYLVLHHTYAPDHRTWEGDKSARGIERFWAAETKKHQEGPEHWTHSLGGHFIVAPEGVIYQMFPLSEVLNADSQAMVNHNGIAIETVGNFDTGHDVLEGAQLHAVAGLFGGLMVRYNLAPERVGFHSDYESYKTCPGSGLNKGWFRQRATAGKDWARSLYPR